MGKSRGKIDDEGLKSDAFAKKGLKQKIRDVYEKMTSDNTKKERYVTKEKSPYQKIKTVSYRENGVEVKKKQKVVQKNSSPLGKDRIYTTTYNSAEGKPVKSKQSLNPLNPLKKDRYMNRKLYKS
jgi:hypothetical protein